MAIPKTIEDILNPDFRIDECSDMIELQAWLSWTYYAIRQASTDVAYAKYDHIEAEEDYANMLDQETTTSEGGITEKKIAARIKPEVIAAKKNVNKAKLKLMLRESDLEGVKEKAACIRKIATLRANMIQFDEVSIADRQRNKSINYECQSNQIPPPQRINTFNASNNNFQPFISNNEFSNNESKNFGNTGKFM